MFSFDDIIMQFVIFLFCCGIIGQFYITHFRHGYFIDNGGISTSEANLKGTEEYESTKINNQTKTKQSTRNKQRIRILWDAKRFQTSSGLVS